MAHSSSTQPAWLEISLQADPVLHDPLSAYLFDLGCTGVVSEDFQDRRLRGYLPFQQDLEEIRNRIALYLQNLQEIFPDIPSPTLQISKMDDQDWGLNWRRFFRPTRVTPGLLILPAWEPIPETDASHIIRMDPGPAFGTGQHPTTRMCLEAMERISSRRPWTLLDVGTGSGILAIYGIKLGAEQVLAVDTDPEAIRWAGQNIRLNHAAEAIRLSQERVEQMREKFSLVCANLILGEILRLMPSFSRLIKTGGWLILSGILENQVREIAASLSKNGLEIRETLHQGEWACVIAAKREEK
jgi:ribosomal protein L11 methyltransferase